MAKSRWEIENEGFNEAKSRHGLEHICHHDANSLLMRWLIVILALTIERLYRLRYLHRGTHSPHSSAELNPRLDSVDLTVKACGVKVLILKGGG